jgi:hypothetical protein
MSIFVTRDELREFVEEATEQIGDPSEVTTLLFVEFEARKGSDRVGAMYDPVTKTLFVEIEEGTVWPLEISDDGPVIHSQQGLIAFGIKKVRAGVWALNPSLNIPNVLHAFVVIHGVPDPAPWERLVLLASEF